MIQGKFLRGTEDLTKLFDIRRRVFCDEQGMTEEEEFDTLDPQAIHVMVQDGNKIVATGRLYQKDDFYKIGRIAVLREERGKAYGDFVVKMLLDKAFQLGANEVNVGAQIQAVNFYKTIGFMEDGEEYIEARIPHIPMKISKEQLYNLKCQHKKNQKE